MKDGFSGSVNFGICIYVSHYSGEETARIIMGWWNKNFDGLATIEENVFFSKLATTKYREIANYLTICYLANINPDMLTMLRNGSLLETLEKTTKKLNKLLAKDETFHSMRNETLGAIKNTLEENRERR